MPPLSIVMSSPCPPRRRRSRLLKVAAQARRARRRPVPAKPHPVCRRSRSWCSSPSRPGGTADDWAPPSNRACRGAGRKSLIAEVSRAAAEDRGLFAVRPFWPSPTNPKPPGEDRRVRRRPSRAKADILRAATVIVALVAVPVPPRPAPTSCSSPSRSLCGSPFRFHSCDDLKAAVVDRRVRRCPVPVSKRSWPPTYCEPPLLIVVVVAVRFHRHRRPPEGRRDRSRCSSPSRSRVEADVLSAAIDDGGAAVGARTA